MASHQSNCTAFEGYQRIASGAPATVALAVKAVLARGEQAPVLVFDDITSRPIEFDLRGTPEDIVERLAHAESEEANANAAGLGLEDMAFADDTPRGRGRPKLGVVAREVTLLPRHWEWLNRQPGGASVALRKLVETARVDGDDRNRQRAAQESVYLFMTALAGNLPDYEDATRALYANDRTRFEELVAAWPADVHSHTLMLARAAFDAQ